MCWRSVRDFDSQVATKFPEIGIVELLSIVGNNGVRDTKSTHYRTPYKVCNPFLRDRRQRLRFRLLGEIIDSYNSVLHLPLPQRKRSYQVNSPLGEGPGADEVIQIFWGSPGYSGEKVTFLTAPYQCSSIILHGRPVVTLAKCLLC